MPRAIRVLRRNVRSIHSGLTVGLANLLAKKRADALLPKPTVAMYVTLFDLDPRLLYLDYFENFELLVDWLGLPESSGVKGHIPRLLSTYEIQEIAKILRVDSYEVYLAAIDRLVAR